MDKIFIRRLKANTIIGTLPEERTNRQDIVLDIELSLPLRAAGVADDLTLSANYSHIERQVMDFIEKSDYFLLEALAENLARLILTSHPVEEVKIAIGKKHASNFGADIGVEITRKRENF